MGILINFDRLNILCAGFFLVFLSYGSASLLAPQILMNMGYSGLGFYTVALLYLVYGACSLFSAAIIKRIGSRNGFVFGSLLYAVWVFCFLLPCYAYENPDPDSIW